MKSYKKQTSSFAFVRKMKLYHHKKKLYHLIFSKVSSFLTVKLKTFKKFFVIYLHSNFWFFKQLYNQKKFWPSSQES